MFHVEHRAGRFALQGRSGFGRRCRFRREGFLADGGRDDAEEVVFEVVPAFFAREVSFVEEGQHGDGDAVAAFDFFEQAVVVGGGVLDDAAERLGLVHIDVEFAALAAGHFEREDVHGFEEAEGEAGRAAVAVVAVLHEVACAALDLVADGVVPVVHPGEEALAKVAAAYGRFTTPAFRSASSSSLGVM